MKILTYVFIILGIIAIAAGAVGLIVNSQGLESHKFNDYVTRASKFNKKADIDGYYGMMGGVGSYSYFSRPDGDGEKYGYEDLKEKVETYISRYKEELSIGDIFIYEDSEYYFSIVEEDTGRGAMELLANPYTGGIFPEYGPNMMWNLKYGMHTRGGMMGRFYSRFSNHWVYSDNEISVKEAYDIGNRYVNVNISSEAGVSEEPHEFYGYYTFHIEENGEVLGMLSVNGFTGEVWFHDWHENLLEIISGHEEDTH